LKPSKNIASFGFGVRVTYRWLVFAISVLEDPFYVGRKAVGSNVGFGTDDEHLQQVILNWRVALDFPT
jgi:hypothetical protein